jgi:hypothetical protein
MILWKKKKSDVCFTFLELGGAQETGKVDSEKRYCMFGEMTNCNLSQPPTCSNFPRIHFSCLLCPSQFQEGKAEIILPFPHSATSMEL